MFQWESQFGEKLYEVAFECKSKITLIYKCTNCEQLYTKPQLYRYTPSFVGNQINQTKADLVFTKMNFEMNRFYISRHQEIQKQEQNVRPCFHTIFVCRRGGPVHTSCAAEVGAPPQLLQSRAKARAG